MQTDGNASSGLAARLDRVRNANGKVYKKDLKVIERHGADPYSLDTATFHELGAWLAEQKAALFPDRRLHLRGIHYVIAMAGVKKPDGTPYRNDDADWTWLGEKAMKAARWLGYVGFDDIVDRRNAEPEVRRWEPPDPTPKIRVGEVEIFLPDEIAPTADVDGFEGTQPCKLVFVGEKSSLGEVLGPVAESRRADLYLPSGDISDTLIHDVARVGAEDGRPMVVLYLSDCDPSGYKMPAIVAQKLRALKDLHFPELEFQMRRVALTPAQVREHDLPSEPIKESDAARAAKWKARTGLAQTEIDAIATLNPDLLARLVRLAVAPFFDASLDRRVREARGRWLEEAQRWLAGQLDQELVERIRGDAEEALEDLRAEVDELNERLAVDVGDVALPVPEIPEPVITAEPVGEPVVDSEADWLAETRRLKDQVAYAEVG